MVANLNVIFQNRDEVPRFRYNNLLTEHIKSIQNPREASSWSRIFLFSLVNVSMARRRPPGQTKNPLLDKVNGSMCAKFQVCVTHINK